MLQGSQQLLICFWSDWPS